MGDSSVEVTEENRDASQEAKGKAMEAMSEGALLPPFSGIDPLLALGLIAILIMYDSSIRVIVGLVISGKLEDAIEHLTNAIVLNPLSAIMYGTRGKRQPLHAKCHHLCMMNHLSQILIMLGNSYVYTASVFIKMKKPAAAIRDANAALEVIALCHLVFLAFSLSKMLCYTFLEDAKRHT
jgi:suppressor of tumorigenicity protein 13